MGLKKLLYRSHKKDYESLTDYIDRLSCWNGFSSKKTFSNYLAGLFNENYDNLPYALYLKDTNATMIECKTHLMLEQLLRRNIPEPRFLSLAKSNISNGVLKVCSKCWQEIQYIRFYWRFDDYIKCHFHDELLIFPDNFSFLSKNIIGKKTDGTLGISGTFPRNLIVESVKFYLNSDYAAGLIEGEIEQHRYIKKFITEVADFFTYYMNVSLNLMGTLALVEAGKLIGFSVSKKMEKIYEQLLLGNESFEKQVRIITAIKVGDICRFYRNNWYEGRLGSGFTQWMVTEVLSIDELFSAYLGFGQLSGTPRAYKFKHEFTGFENLGANVDRSLCLAIFRRNINWPYEKKGDLFVNQGRFDHFTVNPPNPRYGES